MTSTSEASLLLLFSNVRINNSLILASQVVTLFDWIITSELEISLVWRFRKWTAIKIAYMLCRCLPFSSLLLILYHQLAHSTSDHFCNAILRSGAAIIMPAGFLAELLLTLRTWAIWGKGKQLGIYLFGGFALVWVEIIVCEALVLKSMTSTNPPPPVSFLAGCIVMLDGLERYFIAGFASVFAFDLTILFLMVSRGFKLRQSKDFQRLSAVAYRDGITYYLFITVLSLVNLIVMLTLPTGYSTTGLALWTMQSTLHPLVACRVVLHIREQAYKEDYSTIMDTLY